MLFHVRKTFQQLAFLVFQDADPIVSAVLAFTFQKNMEM